MNQSIPAHLLLTVLVISASPIAASNCLNGKLALSLPATNQFRSRPRVEAGQILKRFSKIMPRAFVAQFVSIEG